MAESEIAGGESEQDTPTEQKPKHPGGRPRILDDLEALKVRIAEYFQTEERPTINGFGLFLGIGGRPSVHSYMDRDDEFSTLIKEAVDRIECAFESKLYDPACTGAIFWLKNRGWSDRQEITGADGKDFIPPRVVLGGDDD